MLPEHCREETVTEEIDLCGFLLTCSVTPVGFEEVRYLRVCHEAPPVQRESSFLDGGFLPFGSLPSFPGAKIFCASGDLS